MKKILHKPIRDERGGVMVLALILLAVGGLIIAPLMGFMSTGLRAGRVHERLMHELYAADAGVQLGTQRIIDARGVVKVPGFRLNNADVVVTIVEVTPTEEQRGRFDLARGTSVFRITSTATTIDGETTTTAIQAHVAMTEKIIPEMFFGDQPHTRIRDLTLAAEAKEEGNFYVENFVTLGSEAVIEGNVFAKGNVTLGPGAEIEGDVFAKGNITLGSGAEIEGDVFAKGNITLERGAEIHGNVFAKGNITLGRDAKIYGDVFAKGNVTLKRGAKIYGNVYAGKGDITLEREAKIYGNVYAGKGNVTLGRDAKIYGKVYLHPPPDHFEPTPIPYRERPGWPRVTRDPEAEIKGYIFFYSWSLPLIEFIEIGADVLSWWQIN